MPKRMGLLDADSLIYAASWASTVRDVRYYEDEEPQDVINPEKAQEIIDEKISHWVEGAGVDDWRVALSSREKSHRYFIWDKYKANRTAPKPALYEPTRSYIEEQYRARLLTLPRLEGDDVISTWLPKDPTWKRVVVSIDKDMKQLAGELVIPMYEADGLTTLVVGPQAAQYNLWHQVLTGDTTDGFKGAPGIGPKGAEKVLDGCFGKSEVVYFRACLGAYVAQKQHKKWGTMFACETAEQELLLNLNMARLLTPVDYSTAADGCVMIRYYNPTSASPQWVAIPGGLDNGLSTE